MDVSTSKKNKRRKRRRLEDYYPVILKELKNGLEPVKLRDKLVPHSTLYNILDKLQRSGVIFKDEDGKYYFTTKREVAELKKRCEEEKNEILNRYFYPTTPEDYERRLNHCKMLFEVKGEFGREFAFDSPFSIGTIVEEMYREEIREIYSYEPILSPRLCLLQHIKTGYPGIHALYERWKELEAKAKNAWQLFSTEVNKLAEESGFRVVENPVEGSGVVWQLPRAVEECIRAKGEVDVRTEGDFVMISNHTVSKDKDVVEQLKEFIRRCIKSYVADLYKDYSSFLSESGRVFGDFRRWIEMLALEVKHGKTLKGFCSLCPPVSIINIEKS